MAKPLPLIIGGVGLTGAAVGGVFLAAGSGSGQETESTSSTRRLSSSIDVDDTSVDGGSVSQVAQQATPEASKPEKFFDDVEKFKKGVKDSSCVKGLFRENFTISTDSVEDIGKDKPGSNEFFKEGGEEQKSCLVIQWKKKKADDSGTWNGRFTWLWAFTKGNEGFVTFNVVKPVAEQKKMKFTGGFYLVGRESADKDWSVKFKKEATESHGKKVGKDEWDQYFPKVGETMKETSGGDYWGFIQNKDEDVDKICKAGTKGTCSSISLEDAKVTQLKWTAQKESQKSLWDWTSSDGWWDKIYGVNDWKLKDKLAEIKGTWTVDAGNTTQLVHG